MPRWLWRLLPHRFKLWWSPSYRFSYLAAEFTREFWRLQDEKR